MDNDKTPLGLRKPWQWVQPKTTTELINRLIEARDYNVHERERENLCSVAAGKIEELDNAIRALAQQAGDGWIPVSERLPEQVLAMCKHRGWSLHWTHRGAYLHLEASELIEAIRGKRGDPIKEAADVLLVLMSITEYAGISWQSVVQQASAKNNELMTKPRYDGEEHNGQPLPAPPNTAAGSGGQDDPPDTMKWDIGGPERCQSAVPQQNAAPQEKADGKVESDGKSEPAVAAPLTLPDIPKIVSGRVAYVRYLDLRAVAQEAIAQLSNALGCNSQITDMLNSEREMRMEAEAQVAALRRDAEKLASALFLGDDSPDNLRLAKYVIDELSSARSGKEGTP